MQDTTAAPSFRSALVECVAKSVLENWMTWRS